MKKILFLFLLFFLVCPVFVLAEQIDINSATLSQLDIIVHVGPTIAQRIIDARPYGSVHDLSRVKGIGDGKYLQDIINQGFACVNCQAEIASSQTPRDDNSQDAADSARDDDEKIGMSDIPAMVSDIQQSYPTGVIINEILPSPEGPDEEYEWIELYNQNNFEVDLSDWKIEDAEGAKTTYIFNKNTKIASNGFLVLKRPETKITLNNSEDGLNLYWPNDKIIDSLSYAKAPTNQSYNKTGPSFSWSLSLTPGTRNIITAIETKNDKQNLSKTEKSVNSNIAEAELAALSYNTNQEKLKSSNPWFLFLTAMAITIISAILVLFIKFKLKNNVRTFTR